MHTILQQVYDGMFANLTLEARRSESAMERLRAARERERGTMENLLATLVRPIEVMAGKIAPFIIVGYVQVALILVAAKLLFGVPLVGSLMLLLLRSQQLRRQIFLGS